MPTRNRGRLDQHESLAPARPPPSQAHPEKTVRRAEASIRQAEHAHLMAQGHHLEEEVSTRGQGGAEDRDRLERMTTRPVELVGSCANVNDIFAALPGRDIGERQAAFGFVDDALRSRGGQGRCAPLRGAAIAGILDRRFAAGQLAFVAEGGCLSPSACACSRQDLRRCFRLSWNVAASKSKAAQGRFVDDLSFDFDLRWRAPCWVHGRNPRP